MKRKCLKCVVYLVISFFIIVANIATAKDVHCYSYSFTLSRHESVCFKNSMDQYSCYHEKGEPYLQRVQKLLLKSDLEVHSICTYVDKTHSEPNGPPAGTEYRKKF